MTLAASSRYKLYSPVVLTDTFAVSFPLFDDGDLTVYVDGVVTELYSITATYEDGRSDDAEVVLDTAVTGVDVAIYGTRSPRRENNYLANSPNLAENLQRDIEATTAVQQEQARDYTRSLKLPAEDGVSFEYAEDAAGRANKFAAFDSSGNPTVSDGVSDVPVSTFMAGVVTAADAAAAVLALGLETRNWSFSGTMTVTGAATFGAATFSGAVTLNGSVAGSALATAAQYRADTAGKVLTTDKVWDAAEYVTLTDAATIALDLSTGLNFQVTLGGNRTLGAPSSLKPGQSGIIKVIQDGTGSRTLDTSNFVRPNGVGPTLSTAAGAYDLLHYAVLPDSTVLIQMLARAVS